VPTTPNWKNTGVVELVKEYFTPSLARYFNSVPDLLHLPDCIFPPSLSVMGAFLLAQLRHTRQRLLSLSSRLEAAAEKETFRQLLSATIRDVHALYQVQRPAPERSRLLHHACFLEQQLLGLQLPASSPPPAQWQAGYQALLTTLEATVTLTPTHG